MTTTKAPAPGDRVQAIHRGPGHKAGLDEAQALHHKAPRPRAQRIKYGFCQMHKPVLDDAEWRVFDTMAEYRAWCAASLPEYLGFKPAAK